MKFLYLFFALVLLFGCSSAEKKSYDSIIKEEDNFLEKDKNTSNREIAYLKSISRFDEGNFQFITKQMKEVLKNYNKMKRQLVKIESKLDRFIARQILERNKEKEIESIIEEEVQETQINEDKLVEKKEADEESVVSEESFLKQEMTDDTNIFQDEDEEDKYMENQEKTSQNKPNAENRKPNNKKSSPLIEAKNLFEKEAYENAISKFQNYRDKNPTGKHYPEATFYIGQSFKKLQMPVEAEIFFKEVVQSYPQSLWAGRAKKSLEEKEALED